MIRLISTQQALELKDTIPALAVLRMTQLEGEDGLYDPQIHGHIIVIGETDDISTLPEVSDSGLLAILDPECPGYEFLEAHQEDGKTIWEMGVALDNERTIALIFTESPGLDRRLTDYLDQLNHRQW